MRTFSDTLLTELRSALRLLVWGFAAWGPCGFGLGSPCAMAGFQTAITLEGRSSDDLPPAEWTVRESPQGKVVAERRGEWGTVEVPAGSYAVEIVPQGSGAIAIPWGIVEVREGATSVVKVDSGLELSGRADDTPPLEAWYLFRADDTGKDARPVAMVRGRWGFTPMPAGRYRIEIQPGDLGREMIPWGQVVVERGAVTALRLSSGIELASGVACSDPPHQWLIYRAEDLKKPLTRVFGQWGVTALPPGKYTVVVQPGDLGREEVPWTTLELAVDEVATVQLDSGIKLEPNVVTDAAPYQWLLYKVEEPKTPLTRIFGLWGLTPLPPGKYTMAIQPGDLGREEVPWATIEVNAGEIATVKIDSGIALAGPTAESPPLYQWLIFDARVPERPLTRIFGLWGTTWLPAGEYQIVIQPGDLGRQEIPWRTVQLKAGEFASVKIDSGIELVGKSPSSAPPEQWNVYAATNRTKPITQVYGNWGMTPLPPGDYAIEIKTNEKARNLVLRASVTVVAGAIAKLNAEPALEERLAAVTGAGHPREKEVDPEGYARLEEEIERAIRRGGAWLKVQSALDLNDLKDDYATIGVLALVHSGELERDPELRRRCIDFLQRRSLNGGNATYATALTAMALRDLDPYRYRQRIFDCAQWLVENQGWEGASYKVWGYGREVPGRGEVKALDPRGKILRERPTDVRAERQQLLEVERRGAVAELDSSWDNSNAQFAILGLHSAANSGVGIPRRSWERIAEHFHEFQCVDGGWAYRSASGSYGSMTCAGVASLAMARHHLGEQPLLLDAGILSGLEWLSDHFTVEENPKSGSDHYYFLYGLERAGILAGTEFFGRHEWYPTGARYLLKQQQGDGSWRSEESPSTGSPHDYLDTCYAILFLRRATLPLEPVKPAFLAVSVGRDDLPAALLPAVEVILDSSGSMRDVVGDQPKIKIAQTVMAEVLGKLPNTIQLGFRLYGHREGNVAKASASGLDPAAKVTRLVVPIAPLTGAQREQIKQWVDQAAPWGWTPMVYSVLQAKNDFPRGASSSQTVVLISDGVDTCGGKIAEIGKAYHGSGIDIVLHVVGFDVDKDPAAKKQLMAIATLGGGNYFDASDAQGLSAALEEALVGIEFVVVNPETGSEVARGAVNEEPVTLEPGKYVVHISGLKSEPFQIELDADQVLELRLDNDGKLAAADSNRD